MRNSGRSAFSRSNGAGPISFEIPSETGFIKKASRKVLQYLEPYGLDKSVLFDIKLSFEEAVRNAMAHGNRSNRELPVKINCAVDSGRLEITIEDSGGGFDPKKIPDPTKGANLLKGSGRGVYLIRRLMDEVEYNAKGNRIKIIKNLIQSG